MRLTDGVLRAPPAQAAAVAALKAAGGAKIARLSGDPVVIGGCGRSGTTLLLSVISAHPAVFAINDETCALCPSKYRKPPYNGALRMDKIYRYIMRSEVPGTARRWCEKTPKNVKFFGRIIELFSGKVKLIHIVRDGRDVVSSRHPHAPERSWVSPKRWVEDVRAGLEFRDHPLVLTVKYEDLILDYERTARSVFSHIGEECTAEVLSWHENARVRKNLAWFDGVRPIHAESIGRWKDPALADLLEKFMHYPGAPELLKDLGYEV